LLKPAVLVAALLLAACADQQEAMPPPLEVTVVTEQPEPNVDLDWRDFFTDPRLRALLDIAFINNREQSRPRRALRRVGWRRITDRGATTS
jgi:outer membrane protein TolC